MTLSPHGPARVGIGGPVGSGKTALADALCKRLRDRFDIAVVTNDIYTKEDANFLVRSGALAAERIAGVETGGCPHTAIREDASINLAAVADMRARFPALDLVLIESGGDNLAATFSPELADVTVYVIDVSAGDKIPRKGGPGISRSDLLVINKTDLAPLVGRGSGRNGPRRAPDARPPPLRLRQSEGGRGPGEHRRLPADDDRPGGGVSAGAGSVEQRPKRSQGPRGCRCAGAKSPSRRPRVGENADGPGRVRKPRVGSRRN